VRHSLVNGDRVLLTNDNGTHVVDVVDDVVDNVVDVVDNVVERGKNT